MLACSCDYYDGDLDWYFVPPDDYSKLETTRRKRCASCRELIDIGAAVARFDRWRDPKSEIECDIYGDGGEIHLATWYHCERCADLYFSLSELGFDCIVPDDDMRKLVKEYAQVYGPRTLPEANNG